MGFLFLSDSIEVWGNQNAEESECGKPEGYRLKKETRNGEGSERGKQIGEELEWGSARVGKIYSLKELKW